MLIPVVIGVVIAAALVLLVVYATLETEAKLNKRSSLRAIETYTWQGEEAVAQEASLLSRVIAPMGTRLSGIGKRFTPVGYIENSRRKLQHAGQRGPDELDRYLAMRALTLGSIPILAILVFVLFPLDPGRKFLAFALLAAAIVLVPDAMLNRKVAARQKQIRRMLPDTLDILTISVEAGLGFEQAIDRIVEAIPGPLSDEFNRMIGEIRAGSSRSEALQSLDARVGVEEVKSFVLSMVQADQFGVSIGRVLRAQSEEMRIKRRQLAQEAAQKAPVKMLLPMTFFIFPALFVIILGPAAINIMQQF